MNTKTNKIFKAILFIICVILFLNAITLLTDANFNTIEARENTRKAYVLLYQAIGGILFGVICEKICYEKGRDEDGFYYGYFLGMLGLIIAIALKDKKVKTSNITSKYEELEKLKKLKEAGILTQEEFEKEKIKLLK